MMQCYKCCIALFANREPHRTNNHHLHANLDLGFRVLMGVIIFICVQYVYNMQECCSGLEQE